MQSIIRERILEQLLSIPGLVDQYAAQEGSFMQNVCLLYTSPSPRD